MESEPLELTKTPLEFEDWISRYDAGKPQKPSILKKEDSIAGLFGLDPKLARDWNEEFQSVKELPNSTIFERVQRDRACAKVYGDFCKSAREGAMAVVNNALTAMNPQDPPEQQIFVHNQIFFSHAVD